jgi:hypothetical protein
MSGANTNLRSLVTSAFIVVHMEEDLEVRLSLTAYIYYNITKLALFFKFYPLCRFMFAPVTIHFS